MPEGPNTTTETVTWPWIETELDSVGIDAANLQDIPTAADIVTEGDSPSFDDLEFTGTLSSTTCVVDIQTIGDVKFEGADSILHLKGGGNLASTLSGGAASIILMPTDDSIDIAAAGGLEIDASVVMPYPHTLEMPGGATIGGNIVMTDIGLCIDSGSSINGTVFTTGTINGDIVNVVTVSHLSGAASTRNAVRTAYPSVAIGSQYNSTAGKVYVKVANGAADTDWEKVTTTAAD